MKAFEVVGDKSVLISKQTPRTHKRWTSIQCFIFCFIFMLIGILVTNMDRIISSLHAANSSTQQTDDASGTPIMASNSEYDIIVVGAGPAGLLQTNFLLESYPNLRILVLEKSNRIGGRSCSSVISYPTTDNTLTFEHGAMRFYTSNTRTRQILYYLDQCNKIEPFSNEVLRSTSEFDDRVFSVRNNYVFEKDLSGEFWLNTYNLSPNDELLVKANPGNPPQAFYGQIMDKLLQENDKVYPMTEQDWDDFRDEWTLNDKILNKWTLSMVIKYFGYSSEFEQLIIDSYQFYNQELFPPQSHDQFFFDFKNLYFVDAANRRRMQSENTVFTITTGYDTISNALLSKVTDPELFNPAQILFDQKVIGIDKNDNKYNVMTQSNTYLADQVILAIPPEPLQEILPNIPVLNNDEDGAKYLINSVYGRGLICKMNLIWNDLNIPSEILPRISGSVDASMNFGLGSMYVWYGDNQDGPGQGSLTAVHFYYSSNSGCSSWWNLQQTTQESGIYRETSDGDIVIDNEDDVILLTNDVVDALFSEFSEFMEEKYDVTDINKPIIGTIAPWGALEEWGATLHRYNSGYSSSEVRERISKPNVNENIFIGISDWSVNSGFVEGAMAASVDNLQKNFGIDDFLSGVSQCDLP